MHEQSLRCFYADKGMGWFWAKWWGMRASWGCYLQTSLHLSPREGALPPLDAVAGVGTWNLREDRGRDRSFLSVKNDNWFIMDFFALIDLVKYHIIIHLDCWGFGHFLTCLTLVWALQGLHFIKLSGKAPSVTLPIALWMGIRLEIFHVTFQEHS